MISQGTNLGDQAFLQELKSGALSGNPEHLLLTTTVFQGNTVDLLRGGGGPAVPEASASGSILIGAVIALIASKFIRR